MASRDGRITVRVVMRYLINKLGLEDDSQVCHACLILPCAILGFLIFEFVCTFFAFLISCFIFFGTVILLFS